jgi:hypothetical protein
MPNREPVISRIPLTEEELEGWRAVMYEALPKHHDWPDYGQKLGGAVVEAAQNPKTELNHPSNKVDRALFAFSGTFIRQRTPSEDVDQSDAA